MANSRRTQDRIEWLSERAEREGAFDPAQAADHFLAAALRGVKEAEREVAAAVRSGDRNATAMHRESRLRAQAEADGWQAGGRRTFPVGRAASVITGAMWATLSVWSIDREHCAGCLSAAGPAEDEGGGREALPGVRRGRGDDPRDAGVAAGRREGAMKRYEECQPPFSGLPDGRYELLFKESPDWWAASVKEGDTWKTPLGRFRAREGDGVVAVRKEVE